MKIIMITSTVCNIHTDVQSVSINTSHVYQTSILLFI